MTLLSHPIFCNYTPVKLYYTVFFFYHCTVHSDMYSSFTNKCTFTRAAPKVMPPIYFNGNYNRYKEHNNTI